MTVGKILGTGIKIGAVCLVFALTFIIGGALSGLTKIGQQPPAANNAGRVPSAMLFAGNSLHTPSS